MSHHEKASRLCPLCEEKMKEGHPVLQKCWRAFKQHFPDGHTSWVWRSPEDQKRAYLDGNSRLTYPSSKHNATLDGEPCSRAMDLFFIRPTDGVAEFHADRLKVVGSLLIDGLKLPLIWGGSWKKFPDYDHFQLIDAIPQNEQRYDLPESV